MAYFGKSRIAFPSCPAWMGKGAFLAIVLVGSVVVPDAEAMDFDQFGDWTVMRDVADTGQDRRATCTAMTGGDGDPVLKFEITDGDVGPPTGFPALVYSEPGYRGVAPHLEDGQTLVLAVDDDVRLFMTTHHVQNDPGIVSGEAMPDWGDMEAAWNALRAGTSASVLDEETGETLATFSLAGSAAATLRMLDWCGLA